MKPIYVGQDISEDKYVYGICKCELPIGYALRWDRILDGQVHEYTCVCENCNAKVSVISKSFGPEICISGEEAKEAKEWTYGME